MWRVTALKLGAGVVIPLSLGMLHQSGAKDYEKALRLAFASGIDIVINYLWGESAKRLIGAIAKTMEDGTGFNRIPPRETLFINS